MAKVLFNENQSRDLMAGFLEDLWEHCKERFSPDGFEGFSAFCGVLNSDPGFFGTWRKSCLKTFGKPFSDETLLTEEEVFTAMIEFVAQYLFKWEYNVSEVLNLLFIMRYKPEEAKKEWTLWNEVVDFFRK